MEKTINRLLADLENERGIEILFACESGSRAWGFASPDSDYDIRFLYRRPLIETYSVLSGNDSIEIPIENDLDPSGWDLPKSLGLLAKSNGALIEWLHSPIIYRANEDFLAEIRDLAGGEFCQRALANHYAGMARQVWKNGLAKDCPTGKSYLYGLRAMLCANHVLHAGTIPPVEFDVLLEDLEGDLLAEIRKLLSWKETATEAESPGRIEVLDRFLGKGLEEWPAAVEKLAAKQADLLRFDAFLHRWAHWPVVVDAQRFAKEDFTLQRVVAKDLLLFETVSGSRSFGTDHEQSDVDLRGVFVAPFSFLGGLETIEQVSDEKSDEVYYELGRFISLLLANNPNIVELLFSPDSCIRHRHPAFDLIQPEMFLSKLCRQTFGNYAMGQIRKARGLNKKIVNPEPEQRKHLREFCHVFEGQGSLSLSEWLAVRGLTEKECALVAVRHAPGTYAIFETEGRGIFSHKDDSAVICSSVPKGSEPIGWMNCNVDSFKAHCRAHREYWKWVDERNEERYQTNISHDRGYDSKNLMHTLRLLDQAIEIATEGRIVLPRANAAWLKKVKSGAYDYEELLRIADEKHARMEAAFEESSLRERPCRRTANEILLEVRSCFGEPALLRC